MRLCGGSWSWPCWLVHETLLLVVLCSHTHPPSPEIRIIRWGIVIQSREDMYINLEGYKYISQHIIALEHILDLGIWPTLKDGRTFVIIYQQFLQTFSVPNLLDNKLRSWCKNTGYVFMHTLNLVSINFSIHIKRRLHCFTDNKYSKY